MNHNLYFKTRESKLLGTWPTVYSHEQHLMYDINPELIALLTLSL